MSTNKKHIALIQKIFAEAEGRGVPLWIESGWALDARLGCVTREHGDIDIAYPAEKQQECEQLLIDLGATGRKDANYGFICYIDSIEIESECTADLPFEAFPDAKEGVIEGIPIRCVSWEYMYWEFLYLQKEVPQTEWKERHFSDLEIIKSHVNLERQRELERLFSADVTE